MQNTSITAAERDAALLAVRPFIDSNPTADEMAQFMHQVLRPVLKWQNASLLDIYRHYLRKRKVQLIRLPVAQRLAHISQQLSQDNRLRSLLFGSVIGHFTAAELAYYLANEAEINRRLTGLLVQRMQDQQQFLSEA